MDEDLLRCLLAAFPTAPPPPPPPPDDEFLVIRGYRIPRSSCLDEARLDLLAGARGGRVEQRLDA